MVDETPPGPGLDLAFDWLKDTLYRLSSEASALDQKVGLLLTAAVVVFGISAPSGVAAIPASALSAFVLAILGTLAFGIAAGAGIFALWPRRFETLDNPVPMRESYWDMEPVEFKASVLSNMEDSYCLDMSVLRKKSLGLITLTSALAAETALIAVALWLAP